MSSARTAASSVESDVNLAGEYSRVRAESRALAAPLEPEDCVIQTMPEVSPTKWHLAHVTWFFEKFCLLEYVDGYEPFHAQYDYLFNSYYYSVGLMHPRAQRGLLSRPLLSDVMSYRDHVDGAMLDLIAKRELDEGLAFRVTLGLNHEQQHQELMLTDIKHVFFTNPLGPAYAQSVPGRPVSGVPFEFLRRPAGRFRVGADGTRFCFDNETPRHDVLVGEHDSGNRLVTNGEYRQFIDAGGYGESRLWLADGWAAVRAQRWSRPLCWSEDLESEFTLGGWCPIDPEAPVCHVSQYEADAFANWAGGRLPSEHEWELVAGESPVAGNTLDTTLLHPCPAVAGDPAAGGAYQLWGDVWEWTSSPYTPHPRFKPLEGSLGEYNGKFMSNQTVVRGGSCATWADHLRATYRSFFYPHDRWQFLGFRLARDA
jgi:ergothioneine biosynthesis protein EgtB